MESDLPVVEYNLKHFDLNKLKTVLEENLKDYFCEVVVNVVDCPDLSVAPYNLAVSGVGGGNTGIVDLGGVPYIHPLCDRKKVYKLEDLIPKCIGSKDYPNGWYLSGAAAGPWPKFGVNSEMILNMKLGKDGKLLNNKSKVALISGGNGDDKKDVHVTDLDLSESRCALLANFMVSPGIKGKVLEIKCSKRTKNFDNYLTSSIRNALIKEFNSEPIGLGGLFLVKKSPSKIHVMPDFHPEPLNTPAQVDKWLKFYDMDPPMLFQSVLVTSDPGLALRLEHSHGWSLNIQNEAGHYHYDVEPESVEYHGFFALAEKIYRIDRPDRTWP